MTELTQSRDEMIAEVRAGLASNMAGPVALARLMIRRYDLDIDDPLPRRRIMDPDQALADIRQGIVAMDKEDRVFERRVIAAEVMETVRTLDEWLSKGGFLPSAWTLPQAAPRDDDHGMIILSTEGNPT